MRTLRFTNAFASRFATAAAIAVIAAAWQIASADPAAERRSYEAASAALQKLDDTNTAQLAAWLKSPNAYQRQAALLRYLERPSLMSPTLLQPLLGMLDDGESHPLGDCVKYAFLDDANLNEGTWERRAACWWSAKSNATLATSALETLVRNVRQSGNQRDIALACTQVLEVFEKLKHNTVLSSTAREICQPARHGAALEQSIRIGSQCDTHSRLVTAESNTHWQMSELGCQSSVISILHGR